LLLLAIFHLRIGELSIKMLLCQPLPQGETGETEGQYLSADLRIECYQGVHMQWALAAWVLTIFYFGLFPPILLWKIRRVFTKQHAYFMHMPKLPYYPYPKNKQERIINGVHEKYDFVVQGFRPKM